MSSLRILAAERFETEKKREAATEVFVRHALDGDDRRSTRLLRLYRNRGFDTEGDNRGIQPRRDTSRRASGRTRIVEKRIRSSEDADLRRRRAQQPVFSRPQQTYPANGKGDARHLERKIESFADLPFRIFKPIRVILSIPIFSSSSMTVAEVLKKLESLGSPENIARVKRFPIDAASSFCIAARVAKHFAGKAGTTQE